MEDAHGSRNNYSLSNKSRTHDFPGKSIAERERLKAGQQKQNEDKKSETDCRDSDLIDSDCDNYSVSSMEEVASPKKQAIADTKDGPNEQDDQVGELRLSNQVKSQDKPPPRVKERYMSTSNVTDIGSPLPLLKKGSFMAAEPEAMWKKRRLKQNLAINKLS